METHLMKIKKLFNKGIMILYSELQSSLFSGLNPDKLHKNFHFGNIQVSFPNYIMIK